MDRREIAGGSIALLIVIGLSAWLINEIPQGDSTLPMSFVVFAGIWIVCGAAWGNWKALVLPILFVSIMAMSGVQTEPPADQPIWVYMLAVTVALGLPFTAVGVASRKLIERRKVHSGIESRSN